MHGKLSTLNYTRVTASHHVSHGSVEQYYDTVIIIKHYRCILATALELNPVITLIF